MEKYIDMMKQSANLQDTVHDGLQHIQNLLKVGKYEATIMLFGDIVQAFGTIESTLRVIPSDVVTDEINEQTTKLREALELVTSEYEAANYGKVQEIFQFNVMPRFNKWKENVEQAFSPYIVS